MISDFIINLLAGIAGAILIFIGQFLYKFIRERNAPFTGKWEGIIYDKLGNIEKRNIFEFRQFGDDISGLSTRVFPKEQSHRRWHVSGKTLGREFFGIFWPYKENITSHGSFYLTQVNDLVFTGYYYSLHILIDKRNNPVESFEPAKCSLSKIK
jgi:hypothetical protein